MIGDDKKKEKLITENLNLINNLPDVDKTSIWFRLLYGLEPTSSERIWLEVMDNYLNGAQSIHSAFYVKLRELVLSNKYDLINEILCLPQIDKRDRIEIFFS